MVRSTERPSSKAERGSIVKHHEARRLVTRRVHLHTVPSVWDRSGASAPAGQAHTRPKRRRSNAAVRVGAGDQDGFTLVELLVVVLVLGALVGIAVPTFIQQRDGAWDAAVRSELRAASIALASYRAQNGAYAAGALESGAGWGYEASSDVIMAVSFPTDGFCLRGWYRSDEPAEVRTGTEAAGGLADQLAEWAATPTGIVPLTGPGTRSCPA